MSERPNDAELVARARRGDRAAYGQLYERHFDPIFRYLRLRLEREADAEDLAATVFLRAYQSLGGYRERGWPFSSYLYQIARNALADHYRRRRAEAPLDDLDEPVAAEVDLDERLDRAEELKAMQRVMQTLPDDHQEVIRLRILLGLSTEATAQWMGRSQGAVRVLLHRALDGMRTRLKAERSEGR